MATRTIAGLLTVFFGFLFAIGGGYVARPAIRPIAITVALGLVALCVVVWLGRRGRRRGGFDERSYVTIEALLVLMVTSGLFLGLVTWLRSLLS